MPPDELAAQAQRALDSERMESLGPLRFVDKKKIPPGGSFDFVTPFNPALSTPGLAVCGFSEGKWDKLPNQWLRVPPHEVHTPIFKPGLYALVAPKRKDAAPASSPLHPSPLEAAKASEVAAALAPLSRALTELLAPHPRELSPGQMKGLESLLGGIRFAPIALLNRYGIAVWNRNPGLIGERVDEVPDGRSFLTPVLDLAYRKGIPMACAMSSGGFEVSFPLMTDEVVGVLIVRCEPGSDRQR